MRITQIVPSLEARHGGPSRSVYELSVALASGGHEVSLLATGPGPDESRRAGNLSIEVFHRDRPTSLCPSAGLRARLRNLDSDVIQHHSLWLRTLHYAHVSSQSKDAGFVISPRGMMSGWAWRHHAWKKRLARSLVHPGALKAANGWHATSPEEAADIRARGFDQPVCIAPNGVSIPSPAESEEARQAWLELCPEAARMPVALFHSRFHPKKRVLELIDLWVEHGPRDWLLLMVGIPESYRVAELEDYIHRSLGAGRVRVFDGIGRPPPYPVASIFLLPSHSENFGLAIAEALAHGVPALVTDTTPWTELNANGAGWCVPWADYPAALAAAVAEGASRLRERGAAGRIWVAEAYSWEKPARALVEFYGRINGSKTSAPA